MHTFFINTSDKNVDEGKILFDINYENRALVALKCRIEDWPDKEKGYLACVEKMSEMMDMYDDMNKQFNLIIYIDLSAMRKESGHRSGVPGGKGLCAYNGLRRKR